MESSQLDFLIFLLVGSALLMLVVLVFWRILMNIILYIFVANRHEFTGKVVEIWAEKDFNLLPKINPPWHIFTKNNDLEAKQKLDHYLRMRNSEVEEIFEISYPAYENLKELKNSNNNLSVRLIYRKYRWESKIEVIEILVAL